MEILREMADKGEPHILVRGNGEVLGYWVITSLQTREGNFFADGVPQSTDFMLSLRYHSNNYGNVSQGTPIAPLITRLF